MRRNLHRSALSRVAVVAVVLAGFAASASIALAGGQAQEEAPEFYSQLLKTGIGFTCQSAAGYSPATPSGVCTIKGRFYLNAAAARYLKLKSATLSEGTFTGPADDPRYSSKDLYTFRVIPASLARVLAAKHVIGLFLGQDVTATSVNGGCGTAGCKPDTQTFKFGPSLFAGNRLPFEPPVYQHGCLVAKDLFINMNSFPHHQCPSGGYSS